MAKQTTPAEITTTTVKLGLATTLPTLARSEYQIGNMVDRLAGWVADGTHVSDSARSELKAAMALAAKVADEIAALQNHLRKAVGPWSKP